MMTNMVRIGEESGQLAAVMEQIAPYYKEKMETLVQKVTKLLEPVIIMGMGTHDRRADARHLHAHVRDGGQDQLTRRAPCDARSPATDGGFSILEVVLVMTLMAVIVSIALPTFQRALEQSKADLAVAELRAIAAAQRLYWLDNYNPQANTGYAADLATLQGLDLLDASILSASGPYTFQVASADAASFSVTATRIGSAVWAGGFAIDQAGNVTGTVQAAGQADIVPAPQ